MNSKRQNIWLRGTNWRSSLAMKIFQVPLMRCNLRNVKCSLRNMDFTDRTVRVYWTTLSFLSIFSSVYIYIFCESFLIKDYYWQYASKKIQIVWIHTVAACCSDLLLNFNTSCFISFLLNWISVFSWRNGKKSCSLTSCVACSRFRDSRESANTNIQREETGERRGPLLLFLCPAPSTFRAP